MTHLAGQDRQPTRRTARVWSLLVKTLLGAGAALGAVCLVLAVLAVVLDLSIVLFRTGSMSPAIPAGSAALTRVVEASEVSVGDIVMVERDDALPITHRVVEVEGDGTTRTLTLKGDANAEPDRATYTVGAVRLVLASAPGVAPVLAWVGRPAVMLLLTFMAASVVLWAFWPRRGGGGRGDGASGAVSEQALPGSGTDADTFVETTTARRGPGGSGPVRSASSVGGVVGLVCVAALVGLHPAPAQAAPVTEVIQGAVVRLVSLHDPEAAAGLSPGVETDWVVGVSADAPSPGVVDVSLSAAGPAAASLVVSVASCSEQWVDGICSGDVLVPERVVDLVSDGWAPVETMSSSTPRWLRFAVGLAPGAGVEVQGLSSTVTVRARGFGEEIVATQDGSRPPGAVGPSRPGAQAPDGGLPTTGATVVSVLGAAVAVVLGGVLLRGLGARRRADGQVMNRRRG